MSKALGHADVTTTLLIYGNQDDRRVGHAIREVELAPFHDPDGLDTPALAGIARLLATSEHAGDAAT